MLKTLLLIAIGLLLFPALTFAGADNPGRTIETEHFIIGYEHSATDTLAQDTAIEMEKIWDIEIEELGFKSPLRFNGDRYLVYIDDNNEELVNPRVLGYTLAQSDGTIYIVMSENIEDWDTYITTLAHEFFHAVQYRYLSPEGQSFTSAPSSAFESGAVWIETHTHPHIHDYAYFMEVFFNQPNGSIFLGQRPGLSYWEYALSVWVLWIDENLGSHVIDNLWKELAQFNEEGLEITNSYYPYFAYHRIISWEGASLIELFQRFTMANLHTDDTYEVGQALTDQVRITKSFNSYPIEEAGGNFVSLFGSQYYKLNTAGQSGNLKVTLKNQGDLSYLVSLVPENSSGAVLENKSVAKFMAFNNSKNRSVILEGADQYSHVYLIISPVDKASENVSLTGENFNIAHTFKFDAEFTSEKANHLEKVEIPSQSPYSDLSTSHKYYKPIAWLSDESKNVLEGYSDGTFKPGDTINRAEFLKILVASLVGEPDSSKYNNCYSDVKNDWYAPYVCYATSKGWVEGYGDNTFRPKDPVNKAEAIKMLLETREIDQSEITMLTQDRLPFNDVDEDDWFYDYVNLAYSLRILIEQGNQFNGSGDRTRAEVSAETYRLTALTEAKEAGYPYAVFYYRGVDDAVME